MEPDESISEAVRREMLEEAGSEPLDQHRFFFSHIATSRASEPYMPHVPYPVMWWTYAITRSRVVSAPTSPDDGEQITDVHHLPIDDAISWLADDETDATHAAVARLAAHLKLI